MNLKNSSTLNRRRANVELRMAISDKNPARVISALKQGADPSLKGQTLNWAVFSGKLEIIQLLVSAGAALDLKKGHAMSWDAMHGDLSMVQWMVNQGIKIEHKMTMSDLLWNAL